MTAATLTILVLSVALATTGQLLLKAGMNEVGVESLGPGDIPFLLRSVFTTWQLLLGLAAFGASAVFWLLALSSVPLSTAYPMVSLSYVFILLFSKFPVQQYMAIDSAELQSFGVGVAAQLQHSGSALGQRAQ